MMPEFFTSIWFIFCVVAVFVVFICWGAYVHEPFEEAKNKGKTAEDYREEGSMLLGKSHAAHTVERATMYAVQANACFEAAKALQREDDKYWG